MRARTDMGASGLAGATGPALEQPAQRRGHVVRLEVAPGEMLDEDVDALRRRQLAVEEHDVLAVQATAAAPDVITDLAQEDLLSHLDAEPAGKLLQLLAERLVATDHDASLTDPRGFAKRRRVLAQP